MEYCAICKVNEGEEEHHIIPLSLGGNDNEGNKILLCTGCHRLIHRFEIYNYEEVSLISEIGFGAYFVDKYEQQSGYTFTDKTQILPFSDFIIKQISQSKRNKTLIKAGIAKAKQNGTRIGRPEPKLPAHFKRLYVMWYDKELSMNEFAKAVGVTRQTMHRYINQFENKHKRY